MGVISDDALAQTVMLQLGVWDELAKEPTLSANIKMSLADGHPTHWCLCIRHSHNPDPAENGFQILAYPKDRFDIFTMHAIIQGHLNGSKDVSVGMFEIKPLD